MKTKGTDRLISGLAAAVVAVATLPSLLRAQTPPLRPGQYELKTEMSVAGQPVKMPPRRDVHCYTPEELQNLGTSMGHDKAQNCKVVSSKTTGSTLAFTTECPDAEGKSIIAGTVTHTSPESYHAVVSMKSTSSRPDDPFGQGMSLDITGKRIGECTK
jgi:hypothetical protein